MSNQILNLDRVEFLSIKVVTNDGDFSQSETFPQLQVDDGDMVVLTRSSLTFAPDEIEDPRHFMLVYGIKIDSEGAKKNDRLPYSIEIEAAGYFHYSGDDEYKNEDRFRAVRQSGYQILHGAIREMVSNLTARSRHGLWHLPARNFGRVAERQAKEDEASRQEKLAQKAVHVAVPKAKKNIKSGVAKSAKKI